MANTSVNLITGIAILVLTARSSAGAAVPAAELNWGQWRGPLAGGSSPHGDPPVSWGEGVGGANATNVRWVAALPGLGASTPVVWSNRVVVTAAVETRLPSHEPSPDERQWDARLEDRQRRSVGKPGRPLAFTVLCFDVRTGTAVWSVAVTTAVPHQATHRDGTWASPSPITDGRRIYASFGSRGIHCLDMEGKVLWQRDLGRLDIRNRFGEGASPCLYDGVLVVPFDHQGGSFVTALDAASGAEKWRAARDELTSWSTPIAAPHQDGIQAIVSATRRIRSYALDNGSLLWECGGLPTNAIPSPVLVGDTAYFMGNHRGKAAALIALNVRSGRGDATGNARTLGEMPPANAPYVPSPLVHAGRLYFLRMNEPVLSCWETAGRAAYMARRIEGPDTVYASPVAARERIYIAGHNGTVAVVSADGACRPLAVNRLRDRFTASPAIVGDSLYLRGAANLYRIAPDR